jgi:hypothetical protein
VTVGIALFDLVMLDMFPALWLKAFQNISIDGEPTTVTRKEGKLSK